MTYTPPTQPPYKQLRRPTTDRMIAGVASGLGRYFNVDPTLVRVVFAGVAVLTGGLGLLAYPIMWFLMPEEPADAPAWPHPGPAAPAPTYWAPPGGPQPPAPGAPQPATPGTAQPATAQPSAPAAPQPPASAAPISPAAPTGNG